MSAGNPDQKVYVYAVFSSLKLAEGSSEFSGCLRLCSLVLRYLSSSHGESSFPSSSPALLLRCRQCQRHYQHADDLSGSYVSWLFLGGFEFRGSPRGV